MISGMNIEWQTFLQQQGAHLQDNVVSDFGNSREELSITQNSTVLCDLSQFGILSVSGEDAPSFLQNMLSSDVREVSVQQAQMSSLNTAKGRMLATVLIWKCDTNFYLQLPQSLCSTIIKRLSMYVLRSKVKIEEVSDRVVCMGLSGEGAITLLEQRFGSFPQSSFAVEQHDNVSVICMDKQRYLICTTPQVAPALWQNLAAKVRVVGSCCWDWLNIRNGIPIVTLATQEQFVPQMANLELIGGVSFKKGCYPGQEIVARIQYLGKSKRRMYLAHIEGDAQAGDQLFSVEGEGQICGMVANAALAPEGGTDLLAVVQLDSYEAQTVHLGALQGELLQFLTLPYAIPA